jgi:hypothetical protein
MTIKDEFDHKASALDRANEAIRDNPLAAGLIGAGIAWMLFGAKGFGVMGGVALGAGEKVMSAAKRAGSVAVDAGNAALKVGSAASSPVKDAGSDMVGAMASIVPDISAPDLHGAEEAATETGTAANESLKAIASSGREYGAAIQSRLSESLERQPLLLGAIGLAMGAGIASTFATTEVESEWMGGQGAAARETLQGVADEAKDRARKVVSDVQDEAARQGLTSDAVKLAANSVAAKVGKVAGAARKSVPRPFKSSI